MERGGGESASHHKSLAKTSKKVGKKTVSDEEEGLPLPHLTRENASSQTAEEEEEAAKRRSVQQKCAV